MSISSSPGDNLAEGFYPIQHSYTTLASGLTFVAPPCVWPLALSNEYKQNKLSFLFHFFFSGKRRLAGCSYPLISDFTHRRTRKRSLWHLQLILCPIPPTCTPGRISQNLTFDPNRAGRDVCSHTAEQCQGPGWCFHHYGLKCYFPSLDHLHTVSSLHMGLTSTLHSLYSFHSMSILPLCISHTLLSISTQTAQLVLYCPTSCKFKCFHTTSIRNNNRTIQMLHFLQFCMIIVGILLYTPCHYTSWFIFLFMLTD